MRWDFHREGISNIPTRGAWRTKMCFLLRDRISITRWIFHFASFPLQCYLSQTISQCAILHCGRISIGMIGTGLFLSIWVSSVLTLNFVPPRFHNIIPRQTNLEYWKLSKKSPRFMTFGTLGEGSIRKLCILCTPRIKFLKFTTNQFLRVGEM